MPSSATGGFYRFVTFKPEQRKTKATTNRARRNTPTDSSAQHTGNDRQIEGLQDSSGRTTEGTQSPVSPKPQRCKQINLEPANRIQRLSNFLDTYLPQRRDRSIDHLQYATLLPDLVGSSPLLQQSCDSICYAFLGALHKDVEYNQRARIHYYSALCIVRELIQYPIECVQKDVLIAAMILLAHCESFESIALPGKGTSGWQIHITGAWSFLEVNGPSMIQSHLGRLLYQTVRHYTAMLGLVKRKALLQCSESWPSDKDQARIALLDIVVHIPTELEHCDKFIKAPKSRNKAMQLALRMRALRKDLESWYEKLHGSTGIARYEIVGLSEAPVFMALCDDETFEEIFRFPSTQMRDQHCIYWISSFFVDTTLLDLLECTDIPDILLVDHAPTFTRAYIQQQAFHAASNLCRSFPMSNEPEELTFSPVRPGMRSSSLAKPRDFFEKYGYMAEYHWSCSVISAVDAAEDTELTDNLQANPSWEVKCELTCKSGTEKKLAAPLHEPKVEGST